MSVSICPLHVMADSFVGCQTLILEKRGEELRDFRAGSTPREEESRLLTQGPTERVSRLSDISEPINQKAEQVNQSLDIIEPKNHKPTVAVSARRLPPEAGAHRDSDPTAQHDEGQSQDQLDVS